MLGDAQVDSRLDSRYGPQDYPASSSSHSVTYQDPGLYSCPSTPRQPQKWHKVLGELRSMSITLPGSRGLFSLLQEAFRHQQKGRLRLSKGVHDCLADFHWIEDDLAAWPTSLYKITPSHQPSLLLGAQDVSGYQMGGVWFPWDQKLLTRAAPPLHPLLWRASFPEKIAALLVSSDNPHGTITNSCTLLLRSVALFSLLFPCPRSLLLGFAYSLFVLESESRLQ
jgi:hypothetical protein